MRRLRVVIVVVLASSDLPGWAQAVSDGPGRIEELLGVTIDPEGVTFQVRTGGCTQPENFRIQRFGKAPTQLLLIRTVEDRCEAFVPYGMMFTLAYSQLRLADRETFVVVNPIARAQAVNMY